MSLGFLIDRDAPPSGGDDHHEDRAAVSSRCGLGRPPLIVDAPGTGDSRWCNKPRRHGSDVRPRRRSRWVTHCVVPDVRAGWGPGGRRGRKHGRLRGSRNRQANGLLPPAAASGWPGSRCRCSVDTVQPGLAEQADRGVPVMGSPSVRRGCLAALADALHRRLGKTFALPIMRG
jgi:hypothetical protein